MQRRHSPAAGGCEGGLGVVVGAGVGGPWEKDSRELSWTQQCSSQEILGEDSPTLCSACFCTLLKKQAQIENLNALFLCEVWSADREALEVPIHACPEWCDQLFTSCLHLLCLFPRLLLCSAEGLPDSPRFSTAAVVLKRAERVFSIPFKCHFQSSSAPLSLSPHLNLSVSFLKHLLFSSLTPSPPWSRLSCRMLKPPWMLCCSAQLLVLLTTEVEWESAEEIEKPPLPSQLSTRLSPELSQWLHAAFMIG